MSVSNELERGQKALQDFFFRDVPSGFQQLGYSARQEGFVRNTVGLLYPVSPAFGHDSVVMRGREILESIRLARVRPGVIEFKALKDAAMEKAPKDRNILKEVREKVIKEEGLEDLANIFGNFPNIPRSVVQVCVLLDSPKEMDDPDWLTKATHPLSTYITGGFVRQEKIDDPDFVPALNSIAYLSRLEGCQLAVEIKHRVYGRTSERWKILRRNPENPLIFVGRVANIGR